MEGGCVAYNFESGPIKDHLSSNFWSEDFNVIVFSHNMHIWYNLAENNVTEKIEKYVKLLIAVYLELKFDFILICNKATIDN